MPHTSTWVVVASNVKTKIYKMENFPKLRLLEELLHPESRLRNHEIAGDKPGRSFDSLGMGRHAYQSPHTPKELEVEKFAKEVGEKLNGEYQKGAFQRLYLIANPIFLGLLRQWIYPKLKGAIVAELTKDIPEHTVKELEEEIAAL
jgi:protein required for attachment to host cells